MTDKGRYASHGAFIKKINENFLPKWSKPKLAVINPIPNSKPRQKPVNEGQKDIKIDCQTFQPKHRFQQQIKIKPVPNELVQPFLYIEKVMNRLKKEKERQKQKLKPFTTSKVYKKRGQMKDPKLPEGYKSLFEYELDRKKTANTVFQRLLESEIDNIKEIYVLWNKDGKKKLSQDINIKEEEFLQFMRELIPSKISDKNLKHFFSLYANPLPPEKEKEELKTISIKALSFNYSKFKKTETQIINVMSEKALKERYCYIKKYVTDFLKEYPQLKKAMSGIKEYEETLRQHFQRNYESYQNPFESEIKELSEELEKPIIKYDKEKKENLQKKIQELQAQNDKVYSKLTEDFNFFMEAYEGAIVKNHDLFFTKRTVCKLIQPIIENHPHLTRQLIEVEVGKRQQEKQSYLECLSDLIVEIDSDKKYLQEDCFTLGEVVEIVSMKFKNMPTRNAELQNFTIDSMKKLIKQIKRQFLLKNHLAVHDIDSFPSDQEIPLSILHLCFEMECTKVLFKNQIWTQLLQMIPEPFVTSKYHQLAIDANTCMQYLRKYFTKLDEKLKLELNKSKEISLIAENAHNGNFGKYFRIIQNVTDGLDHYVEGATEEESVEEGSKKKKKVGFLDIVDTKMNQEIDSPKEEFEIEDGIAKNLIKMIHTGGIHEHRAKEQSVQEEMPENLSMLKTLAKSYFQPEAVNTNAFDIRFFQKINEQEKKVNPVQEEFVKLGTSHLLQNVPKVEEIEGEIADPLRISRFLLKNIDHEVQENQRVIKNKEYEHGIGEGIQSNYYRQKLKLQNKPTRYDCEGRSKYSVLLPVGYYEGYIVGENVPDEEKWYLRPHHLETLTENPLSKKDNIIHTQYKSKLEKIPLKKRPEEFVIEENVKRKEDLINSLEDRILSLKKELVNTKRESDLPGTKVSPGIINQYYEKAMEGKEDKEMEMAIYDGVLYDLRRKERELLNNYRNQEKEKVGEPGQKWWERKDKNFNHELRKDRKLVADEMKGGNHHSYIEKLKNSEIY